MSGASFSEGATVRVKPDIQVKRAFREHFADIAGRVGTVVQVYGFSYVVRFSDEKRPETARLSADALEAVGEA